MTGILRDEWGFERRRRVRLLVGPPSTRRRTASRTGRRAGASPWPPASMSSCPNTCGYSGDLAELVRAGDVPEHLVDRAAPAAAHKAGSACSTPQWTPEGSAIGSGDVDLDSPRNRAIARELAESRSSCSSNDGCPTPGTRLPATPRTLALVGPCADDALVFMGVLLVPQPRREGRASPTPPPARCRGGVAVGGACARSYAVEHGDALLGAARSRPSPSGGRGGDRCRPRRPTCGGGPSATTRACSAGEPGRGLRRRVPGPPGVQDQLVEAVLAAVRRSCSWSLRPALRAGAYPPPPRDRPGVLPGEEGGPRSPGSCLVGVAPPGGLPVQVPADLGRLSRARTCKPPLGRDTLDGVSNLDPTPAFPLRPRVVIHLVRSTAPSTSIAASWPTDGEVSVSVRGAQRRVSARATEVVQLYLARPGGPGHAAGDRSSPASRGCRSSRASAARRHVHACTPTGRRSPASTSARIVEPGEIRVMIGASSEDIRGAGGVHGSPATPRVVGHDRVLDDAGRAIG